MTNQPDLQHLILALNDDVETLRRQLAQAEAERDQLRVALAALVEGCMLGGYKPNPAWGRARRLLEEQTAIKQQRDRDEEATER